MDGVYFITICTSNKEHYFGEITNSEMQLSSIGKIVKQCIEEISNHYKEAEVTNYVVMPNHVHIMLHIAGKQNIESNISTNYGCLRNANHEEPCEDFHHNSKVSTIIGSFKAAVSRKARIVATVASTQIDGKASIKIWQSRYHDHIVRNNIAYENIMNYINNNVINWNSDCFNSRDAINRVHNE